MIVDDLNIFADTAPAYFAAGKPVIPLYRREKRPVPMDWSQFHDTPVPVEMQESWIGDLADGNIGLVLGAQSGVCMLDIDTEDESLITLIKQIVPNSPWTRIGQKGCVLAFRYTGLKTFRVKNNKGESICELLSDRTQVVLPPSIHPKTQMPYVANCDLLSVIDKLPALDNQIEAILRGALKDAGVELSISGHTRVTDYVSQGSRDTSLTEKAGLFAYAVMRGERTLKEAVGMLRSYEHEFIENTAGDGTDIEKHVTNLIRFLHRDVMEKGKQLPEGWDTGLTDAEREELGVVFEKEHVEWSFDEMRDYLRDEFSRHPGQSDGRMKAVEYILDRVAKCQSLSSLDESRLLQYIADVGMVGLRVPSMKARVRELRSGGIQGTDHNEIAVAVLDDMSQINEIRRHGAMNWKYNGSHWERVLNEDIMAKISTDYGHLAACRKHGDHKGVMATIENITPKGIKSLDIKGVNFANGFLTEELELKEHDSCYGMTYTMPFRYMPQQAGNSPHFFQFLEDCWGKDEDVADKLMALQEALCVTVFGMGPRYQRVILLKGVAKAGKSELLKIVQSLVPEDAKSFVPPNDWSDKFLPSQMHEKLINVCGELSEKRKIDGQKFKDIVDGAEMSAQNKGTQIYKFQPICTHWFASNHTPKTDDTSEGFNRRWLILEFNHPVAPEKRRIDIGDIIVAEEREAIVAWAVQAMPRLLRNSEYTLPASHKQLIREVAQENNSVRFFMEASSTVRVIREGLERTSHRISEGKLYQEYFSFCFGPGGARPVGSRAFRQRMRELTNELGIGMEFETNQLGNQEVFYTSLTLAGSKTK